MKIFRLEEAIAQLPALRPLLESLVRVRRDLAIALLEADVASHLDPGRAGGNPTALRQRRARELQRELLSLIESIQRYDCVLKDLNLGLVDFPALRGGQVVNLCWKMDEPTISFWHGTDEGFAARKSLSKRRT